MKEIKGRFQPNFEGKLRVLDTAQAFEHLECFHALVLARTCARLCEVNNRLHDSQVCVTGIPNQASYKLPERDEGS